MDRRSAGNVQYDLWQSDAHVRLSPACTMMAADGKSPVPATGRLLARGTKGEETLHRASLIIGSKPGPWDPGEAHGDIE